MCGMFGRGKTTADKAKRGDKNNEQPVIPNGVGIRGVHMIFCDDDTCKFNDGSGCTAVDIHIAVEFGSMEQGKQHVYNVCREYEVKEDAGTD